MTKKAYHILLLFIFLISCFISFSQGDTTKKFVRADSLLKNAAPLKNQQLEDSLRRAFSPKKATIRSAILPGRGQVYVRRDMKTSFIGKYWKLPIIYGALGITTGIFFYNMKNYRELRFAYAAKYKASLPAYNPASTYAGPYRDSTDYRSIPSYLIPIDINSLRSARDEFRRNIDYSALFFLLFWGLNVVDATVDAHLKTFDVSPDLSLKFKIGPSQLSGTTGISLILAFK